MGEYGGKCGIYAENEGKIWKVCGNCCLKKQKGPRTSTEEK